MREVVVQPQRGLIVDDQGRPLVANRTAWVVSRRPDPARQALRCTSARSSLRPARPARSSTPRGQIQQALVTCGEPGSKRGHLLERLAVPAGPGRHRRPPAVALRILEQPEDYPGGLAAAAERARLPPAVRREPRPRRSATSARSPPASSTQAKKDDDTSVNGACTVGRAGRREGVRPLAARHARLQEGRRRLDGPGARRRRRGRGPARRHPGHLDRRAGAGRRPSRQLARRDHDRARDLRPGHPPQLRAPTPAPRSCWRPRPAGSSRWPASRRTTRGSGSAASPRSSWPGSTPRRPATRCSRRAYQGQFAPGSTWKPIMTVGALNNGFGPSTRLDCSSGFQVGNRLLQELRVRVLRRRSTSPRRCRSPATRSSTGSATTSGRSSAATRPTSTPRTRWSSEAKAFGFGRPTGIDLPGEAARPDRRPALEARLLEGDEGLLLQDRPEAAGAPAPSCSCSPTSSASRAATTAPATR